jgi:DNA-binding NarL/FixJ family response regulator
MTAAPGNSGSGPRVVLADDQPLMRAAFRTILETDGIEVVGEAGDGDAAVAVTHRVRPDVVLMDVRMPGRDGIDATAEIVAALDGAVRVLVLTTFDDDEALYGALAAGAAGFLLKNSTPEEVLQAIRRVAAGDAVLDPTVTGRVFAASPVPATVRPAPAETPTPPAPRPPRPIPAPSTASPSVSETCWP